MPLFVTISAEYFALLSIHIGGALSKLCCWSVEPSTGGQSIAGSVLLSCHRVKSSSRWPQMCCPQRHHLRTRRQALQCRQRDREQQRSAFPLRCASSSVVNALLTKLSYLTSGLICFCVRVLRFPRLRRLPPPAFTEPCEMPASRWLDADQLTWPGPSENSRTSAALKGSKSCPGRTRPPTR